MSLQAIKYANNQLQIIDQLQLPFVTEYIPIRSAQDGWHAIKEMRVRGAPAIAIVAILSLAVELSCLLSKSYTTLSPAGRLRLTWLMRRANSKVS